MHLTPSSTFLTIYIPTTPNPTTGYLVMVRPEDVVVIISSGIVGKDPAPPKRVFPDTPPTMAQMPAS
jgi:uncharacterized membrane protein